MENTSYVALSRQVALRDQMDIVANNIANMSTPGFRAQNMVFTEYLNKTGSTPKPDTKEQLSMVLNYGHFEDTRSGPMRQTGNPLDIAIQGPGYFGVQTNEGVMYTRAGNFLLNVNRELVTGSGQPVVDQGGGIITIPEEASEIRVSADGFIATDDGEIGKLKVVEFDSVQNMEAIGNGLYKTDSPEQPAENTTVLQGMLEGSNVQPIVEMTRMIDVLRSYQATQKMVETEHERQRSMIQKMTQA